MVRMLRPYGVTAAAWLALAMTAASGCSREPASQASAAGAEPVAGGSLIASVRSDPQSYNRLGGTGSTSAATELLTLLTQARLVRVDRTTDRLEPWLAERWEASADGLTYTLHLRRGLRFSDGAPFSADDVLFSFAAVYDESVGSSLAETLQIEGRRLAVAAPDADTVVVTFPSPSGAGLRLLENLPILPRHRLEPALKGGTFGEAWTPAQPLSRLAGLGPFVLKEHVAGQRLVFERNPYYFRQDDRGVRLPYLDRLTLLVVPDQSAEALKLQSGETDLLASATLRPQDLSTFTRLAEQGTVRMIDIGLGLDPDSLWFNLSPKSDPDGAWHATAFRQAVSLAIDRQAIADTVYLGAAAPIAGPTSPGNRTWFAADLPPPAHDPARARALLAGLGYRDGNGDGLLEDRQRREVGFALLAQHGHLRGRVAAMVQEQLRQVGIAVHIVSLETKAMQRAIMDGAYEAAYYGIEASSPDPGMNQDFWLSSGSMHFWNPLQPRPATAWEARINALMHEQATSTALEARQHAFAEVQRIMIEQAPAIYLVAPRVITAVSRRVGHVTPAPQSPQLLWSADTLSARPAR